MKKLFTLLALSSYLSSQALAMEPIPAPDTPSTAYLVEDVQSGQILAEQNMDKRIEPASLTKLMTAYVTFSALKNKQITLDQMVTPSKEAWKTEGSRMFLDPRTPVSVENLIKGMLVQSGNDACVALAQTIAGSQKGFVALMNRKAKDLGLTNTHFSNVEGLPDNDLYTTAHDLSKLAIAVMQDFPEYYYIFSIKEFTYNKITQKNRNGLLFTDPYIDGMKTGHTSSAGYNLIATSKRDNRRVLSVLIGADSAKNRVAESGHLLDWALNTFETPKLYAKDKPITTLRIYKGVSNDLNVGFLKDIYITIPKGESKSIKPILEFSQPIIAPITKGQKIGTLSIMVNGKPYAKKDVVALNSIKEAGFFGRIWDSILLWFKKVF